MSALTPREARRLRRIADDLVTGTQGRTCWFGAARGTSLAILARAAEWLGDTCGHRHSAWPRPGDEALHLPCLRPAGHLGDHTDTLGQSWQHEEQPLLDRRG